MGGKPDNGHGLRRWSVLIAVAAAALLLVAVPQAPARTKVSRYTPFTHGGGVKSTLYVSYRSGYCPTASFVAPRGDTWRCFTGNWIRDPCFESPLYYDDVVCLDAPWDQSAVRVETYLDYSSHYIYTRHVWALAIWRRRCVFVSGAGLVVRGRRANFMCGHGRWLLGSPNRGATWHIRLYRPSNQSTRWVRIQHAWH